MKPQNTLKTFAEKWQYFDAVDLPPSFTKDQRQAARKIFVVGALAMLDMQISTVGSLDIPMQAKTLAHMAFTKMREDLLQHATWPTLDVYSKADQS